MCGDNLIWVLDDEGTLTISGTGDMYNNVSWNSLKDLIITVVIENSVTSIGSYAFSECESLESIIIPDSVKSIGEGAFFLRKSNKYHNT